MVNAVDVDACCSVLCGCAQNRGVEGGGGCLNFKYTVSLKKSTRAHKATGMVIKAQELAEKHGYFYPNQFENEANAWIHEHTTGPEIVRAFEGMKLDHLVTAYGTGGNVLGMSRCIRKELPDMKIHLCEPSNAPMLYSEIPTTYPAEGEGPSTQFEVAHPIWRPHLFQGWAADFIPKLVTKAQNEKV